MRVALVRPTDKSARSKPSFDERFQAQLNAIRSEMRRNCAELQELLDSADHQNRALHSLGSRLFDLSLVAHQQLCSLHRTNPLGDALVAALSNSWWRTLGNRGTFDAWLQNKQPRKRRQSAASTVAAPAQPIDVLVQATRDFNEQIRELKKNTDVLELRARLSQASAQTALMSQMIQQLVDSLRPLVMLSVELKQRPPFLAQDLAAMLLLGDRDKLLERLVREEHELLCDDEPQPESATISSASLSDDVGTKRTHCDDDAVEDYELAISDDEAPHLVKRRQ